MKFGIPTFDKQNKKSPSYPKFGLNENARLKKLVLNKERQCLDLTMEVSGRDFFRSVYPIDNEESLMTKGVNVEDAWNERMATVYHIIKATGVSDDYISEAIGNGFDNWNDWIRAMFDALHNWQLDTGESIYAKFYDVFLEYQPYIKTGYSKKFLQIPYSVKFGEFICEHKPPVKYWKKIANERGLIYEDMAGNIHPFTRTAWYMQSKYAKKIDEEVQTNNIGKVNEDNNPNNNTFVYANNDNDLPF